VALSLKEIIRVKGIKQKWLAQKMGVSEVTVSNWVKGKATPSADNIGKLALILKVSPDELI